MNVNSSYGAFEYVWMLTPSTPTRAIWNTASSAHSDETNPLLTPGAWPQDTEFISSIRSGTCRACATPTYRAMLFARSCEAVGERKCAIVGYCG